MTTELARRQTSELNLTEVKNYLSPKATDAEAYQFIRFCQAYDLNPWIREVYLVKYDANAAASIVVGKDAVMKRAQAAPDYKGHHAGVVVKDSTGVREIEGSMVAEGSTLIGGWCRLNPRDKDSSPTIHRVSMEEYNRKQALWKTMPATMIRKVAVVQAHREAYPELVGGMYDSAEMPNVIEGTGTVVPSDSNEAPAAQGDCPIHKTAWFEGKWGTFHYIGSGKDTCKPTQAYKEQVAALAEELGIPRAAVNDIVKARYDGKTWSRLDIGEIEDFISHLSDQRTSKAPPAVDPETGEVLEEAMSDGV